MYSLLGLTRHATPQEIKKAYYRLAKKWHPDVSSDLDAKARFQRLGNAYQVLMDPRRRRLYDLGLDQDTAVHQRRDYYRYGTSVRNPSRETTKAGEPEDHTNAPQHGKTSFLDHFLFASLLFMGLMAVLYGSIDAFADKSEEGPHYYGIVLGVVFTTLLLIGWSVLGNMGRKKKGRR